MEYETAVRQVTEAETRRRIARTILEALPDWFGIRESREEYINASGTWTFFAAYRQGSPAGFLCLKETGKATAELAVMGVLSEYHRQGIGRALFEAAREEAVRRGYRFLQVKTVAMGYYETYDRTNRFYQSMGFQEFEVFPELWDRANPCQVYVMGLEEKQKSVSLTERQNIVSIPSKKEIDDYCGRVKAGEIALRYEKRYVEFDEDGSYLGQWRLYYEDPEGAMDFLDRVLLGCDAMLKMREYKDAADILDQVCRLEWTAKAEKEEETDFTIVTACRNRLLSMTQAEISRDWTTAVVESREWNGRELAKKLLELLNEPVCEDWKPVELLGRKIPPDTFSQMICLLEEEIGEELAELENMYSEKEWIYPNWRLKKDIDRKQELIAGIRSKCMLPEEKKADNVSVLAACWKQIKDQLTRLSYEPYIDDQLEIDEVWEICEALIKRGGLEQEDWQLRRRILKELVENDYYDYYSCYDPLHDLVEHFCTEPWEYLELADMMESCGYEWRKAADLYLKYGREDKYVDILEVHLEKDSKTYVDLMNYYRKQKMEDEARHVAEQCLEKCKDELTDIFIFLLTDAERNGQAERFQKYYNSAKRRRSVDMGRLEEALRKETE